MSLWLAPSESESQSIQRELIMLFSERLNVHVSSEENLFEGGILDSQKFVELMMLIEEQFKTQIDIADFELENFVCVERIASMILRRKDASTSLYIRNDHSTP
jgi:acyl carrier protein